MQCRTERGISYYRIVWYRSVWYGGIGWYRMVSRYLFLGWDVSLSEARAGTEATWCDRVRSSTLVRLVRCWAAGCVSCLMCAWFWVLQIMKGFRFVFGKFHIYEVWIWRSAAVPCSILTLIGVVNDESSSMLHYARCMLWASVNKLLPGINYRYHCNVIILCRWKYASFLLIHFCWWRLFSRLRCDMTWHDICLLYTSDAADE